MEAYRILQLTALVPNLHKLRNLWIVDLLRLTLRLFFEQRKKFA
jgi:hypothetical protein